jgi:hypothetical protein
MSYMRGNNYLWSDGEYMHLWVADGYDGWDESGWNTGANGKPRDFGLGEDRKPSGIKIPEKVLDEFVMMRLAQMLHEGVIEDTIDRAIQHGNFGGMMLKKNAAKMKAALAQIKLDELGPEDV